MRRIICITLILTVSVVLVPDGLWAKSWKVSAYQRHSICEITRKILHRRPGPIDILRRNSALEAKISDLQTRVDALQGSVTILESGLGAAGKTIAELQEKLVAAEETISEHGEVLSLAQQTMGELNARLALAEDSLDRVQPILALGDYMSVAEGETINGLSGPHVIFTGVNVHVRSGFGYTDDGGNPKGLGNLIIGYNEEPDKGVIAGGDERRGSHNVIIGPKHRYSSYGGLIAGSTNIVSGPYCTVAGGESNTASGDTATVGGGYTNTASEYCSSVSGGRQNKAESFYSTVGGGLGNQASGFYSSVTGGQSNTASGVSASVSGGSFNTAGGEASSISGGKGCGAWNSNSWRAGSLVQSF